MTLNQNIKTPSLRSGIIHHPHPKGFTLVEIVVVMGVIAIIMAGAVSFLGKSDPGEVIDFENELSKYVQDTRLIALHEQSAYYLHFEKDKIWRSRNKEEESLVKDTSDAYNFPVGIQMIVDIEDTKFDIKEKSITKNWLFSSSGLIEQCKIEYSLNGSSGNLAFDTRNATPVTNFNESN
ncbi:type II secretion system GspH family protein [Akkermansiaceae bacterium]|nr:type II secretion system GspH family protein [Akkermansiaceae bacterium]